MKALLRPLVVPPGCCLVDLRPACSQPARESPDHPRRRKPPGGLAARQWLSPPPLSQQVLQLWIGTAAALRNRCPAAIEVLVDVPGNRPACIVFAVTERGQTPATQALSLSHALAPLLDLLWGELEHPVRMAQGGGWRPVARRS